MIILCSFFFASCIHVWSAASASIAGRRRTDVVFERVEVVLDDADEALVVVPVKVAAGSVGARPDALEDVALGDADERENLVDVGQPEQARRDRVFALE